jgi:ribonuclease P protein component
LRLSACSKRHVNKFLIIEYRFADQPKTDRLGITVTSRFGNAVVRNKFKRRIREIFRYNNPFGAGINMEMNIILRPHARNADFHDIEKEILQFKTYICRKQ